MVRICGHVYVRGVGDAVGTLTRTLPEFFSAVMVPGLRSEQMTTRAEGGGFAFSPSAVAGLKKVQVFTEKDLDNIVLSPRTSVHDFDLNFQLKYLKKLGKLKNVIIIGLPMSDSVDLRSVKEKILIIQNTNKN